MTGSAQHQAASDPGHAAVRRQGGDNIVGVKVGPYLLALPAAKVLTIVEPLALHTLPWAGGGVLGVANFRDQVALVVSVRQKLGLADLSGAEAGQFILTWISTGLTAFWVDQTLNLIDRRACKTGEIKTMGRFTPFWRCLLHQHQILFEIDFETLFALTPPKAIHLFRTEQGNKVDGKHKADVEPSVEAEGDKTRPSGVVPDPAPVRMGRETGRTGVTVVKAKQPPALCRVKSSPRDRRVPASAVDPGFWVARPSRPLQRQQQTPALVKQKVIQGPAPGRFRPAAEPVKTKSRPWPWIGIGLAIALFMALAAGWWLRPVAPAPPSSRAPVLAAAPANVQSKNPVSTSSTRQKALPGEGGAGQEAGDQGTLLEEPLTIPIKAEPIPGEEPSQPSAPPAGLQVDPRAPEAGPMMPVAPEPLQILEIQSDTFTLTIERQVEPQTEQIPLLPAGQKSSDEIIHVVVKGDTLWHIAKRYLGDPWRYAELAALSRVRDPDWIYPGDVIRIVKKGRNR